MSIPEALNDLPIMSECGLFFSIKAGTKGFDTNPGGGNLRVAVRVNQVVCDHLDAYILKKKVLETKDYKGHNLPDNERGKICIVTRQNPENIRIFVINELTRQVIEVEDDIQIYVSATSNRKVAIVDPKIDFQSPSFSE